MNGLLEVSLRTIIGFLLLLTLTRLLGKKQLGQLTIFTYITSIAMGNIAGDMVVHRDVKLIEGVVGLILWAGLTFLIEYISLKSSKARVLLDGEPTIVIKKGELMQKELAALRLNMDDLSMLLRINDVFSIKEVDYAILEPNGQLSVLKKPENTSVTKSDMKIQANPGKYLPTEIIVDGKMVDKNVKAFHLDPIWLANELKKAGIQSSKEVFFAELQSDGSLYINKKN
jgi:uncharacterized membrane protein YcaP (DUF421 family)